jgi:DNA-binding transcriptional MerR regulator
MDPSIFMKSSEIAAILGISRRTLALWVKQGRIPEPVRSPAGYFLWTEADLVHFRWIAKRSPGPQRGTPGRRRAHAA